MVISYNPDLSGYNTWNSCNILRLAHLSALPGDALGGSERMIPEVRRGLSSGFGIRSIPTDSNFCCDDPWNADFNNPSIGGSGKFLHLFWKVSERIVSEIGGSSYPEYCKGPPLTTMDSNSRDSPGTVCRCIRMARERLVSNHAPLGRIGMSVLYTFLPPLYPQALYIIIHILTTVYNCSTGDAPDGPCVHKPTGKRTPMLPSTFNIQTHWPPPIEPLAERARLPDTLLDLQCRRHGRIIDAARDGSNGAGILRFMTMA